MIAAALEDSHADWLEDAVATNHALAHAQSTLSADDLTRELRQPPQSNLPAIPFT